MTATAFSGSGAGLTGITATPSFSGLTGGDFCTAAGTTAVVCSTASTGSGSVVLSSNPTFGNTIYGSGATSTYGSITIDGSKNGWSGINFKQSGTNQKTFMINTTYSGIYNNTDNNWDWYNAGGNMYSYNYYHFSDERLKNNIETVKDGLGIVEQLRGVSFDWKKDGKHATGVIAQEVEKVMPFAVEKSLNGFKTVNYDEFIGPVIEAIKQLKADNDNLRAMNDNEAVQIKTLTARLDALEAKRR